MYKVTLRFFEKGFVDERIVHMNVVGKEQANTLVQNFMHNRYISLFKLPNVAQSNSSDYTTNQTSTMIREDYNNSTYIYEYYLMDATKNVLQHVEAMVEEIQNEK